MKEHELRQAVSEREAQLAEITQSLAEYKHRALQAEVCVSTTCDPTGCDLLIQQLRLEENSTDNARTQALEQEVKEKALLIGKLRHESGY